MTEIVEGEDDATVFSETRIVRTKDKGTFEFQSSKAWGQWLAPCNDPEGRDLTEDDLRFFFIKKGFPKVPGHLWHKILSLYFEFASLKKSTEVSVVFLRSNNPPHYDEWRVLVPTQKVTGARVEADFKVLCDIDTGEEVRDFPPEGWVHVGSSHSHNSMGAFFSAEDDKSELSVPGLHIVVGRLDIDKLECDHKASIVIQRKRYNVETKDVVELEPVIRSEFHPNVLNYVKNDSYTTSNYCHSKNEYGKSFHGHDDDDYGMGWHGGGYLAKPEPWYEKVTLANKVARQDGRTQKEIAFVMQVLSRLVNKSDVCEDIVKDICYSFNNNGEERNYYKKGLSYNAKAELPFGGAEW